MTIKEKLLSMLDNFYGEYCPYETMQESESTTWNEAMEKLSENISTKDGANDELENLEIQADVLDSEFAADISDTDLFQLLQLCRKTITCMRLYIKTTFKGEK